MATVTPASQSPSMGNAAAREASPPPPVPAPAPAPGFATPPTTKRGSQRTPPPAPKRTRYPDSDDDDDANGVAPPNANGAGAGAGAGVDTGPRVGATPPRGFKAACVPAPSTEGDTTTKRLRRATQGSVLRALVAVMGTQTTNHEALLALIRDVGGPGGIGCGRALYDAVSRVVAAPPNPSTLARATRDDYAAWTQYQHDAALANTAATLDIVTFIPRGVTPDTARPLIRKKIEAAQAFAGKHATVSFDMNALDAAVRDQGTPSVVRNAIVVVSVGGGPHIAVHAVVGTATFAGTPMASRHLSLADPMPDCAILPGTYSVQTGSSYAAPEVHITDSMQAAIENDADDTGDDGSDDDAPGASADDDEDASGTNSHGGKDDDDDDAPGASADDDEEEGDVPGGSDDDDAASDATEPVTTVAKDDDESSVGTPVGSGGGTLV